MNILLVSDKTRFASLGIRITLLVIILLGLVLRIYKLGYRDLWFDEVYSAYLAQYPQFISGDTQAPLHSFLLAGLVRLTGLSEFWLRFPAFIFGCLSIIAIYLLGKLLFERKVALWAALLLTISPLHIWYSQEARAYTQSIFLVILAIYFFVRCIREDRLILWIALLFTQAAGIYTNYLFPLVLIPQGIIVLFKHNRRHIKNWFLTWCGVILFFLPWLNVFIRRLQFVAEEFWIPRPTPFSFYITFSNFNLGYTATPTIYFISSILFLAILIIGICRGLKKYRESTTIIILFVFLPIISAFLVSQLVSIYISRQMALFLPGYLLLIGSGIHSIKKQILKMVLVSGLLCFVWLSLTNYYQDKMPAPARYHLGTYIKRPVRPATKFIQDNYREGDIIAFTNPQFTALFWYYLGEDYSYRYFIIPDAQDEYWRRNILTYGREGYIIDLTRVKILPYKRIWLISGNWARDGNLDENSLAVKSYLESEYSKMLDYEIEGIRISLYIKNSF